MTYRDSATQLNTTPAATNTSGEQTYIERGQPQVSNLLEELPGVELQRFSSGGGPGANTVAALRGGDPAETHVSAQTSSITTRTARSASTTTAWAPPALGGGTSGSTLYFTPPRQITLQLTREIDNANP